MTLTGLRTVLPLLASLLAYYLESPGASGDIMTVKDMLRGFINGEFGSVDEVEVAQSLGVADTHAYDAAQLRVDLCVEGIVRCLEVHSMAKRRQLLFVVEVLLAHLISSVPVMLTGRGYS